MHSREINAIIALPLVAVDDSDKWQQHWSSDGPSGKNSLAFSKNIKTIIFDSSPSSHNSLTS
jgi:hypothetical protein